MAANKTRFDRAMLAKTIRKVAIAGPKSSFHIWNTICAEALWFVDLPGVIRGVSLINLVEPS
jgi:hypothetical protein